VQLFAGAVDACAASPARPISATISSREIGYGVAAVKAICHRRNQTTVECRHDVQDFQTRLVPSRDPPA
jgi:hypothetical protein